MKITNYLTICILTVKQIISIDFLKSGSQIQVNTITTYDEKRGVSAYLTTDKIVTVWVGGTAQTGTCPPDCYYNIYFNIWDTNGKRLTTDDIIVNNPTSFELMTPQVISDSIGGFVILWELNNTPSYNYIYARHYDSNLTPGQIVQVNNPAGNESNGAVPAFDRLKNGNYIVVWNIMYNNMCIWAQILDPNLKLIGVNFPVNDNPCHYAEQTVSALDNGGFVVAYDCDESASQWYATVRFFDQNGTPVQKIGMNPYGTAYSQYDTAVTRLRNSNIVVTWRDESINGGDIFGKILAQNGNSISGSININTNVSQGQIYNFAIGLTFGGFVVVWSSLEGNYEKYQLKMQIFSQIGEKIGFEQQVNDGPAFNQFYGSITEITKDERFLVTWYSVDQIQLRDVWSRYYYKDMGICKDITAYAGKQVFNIDFSALQANSIVFRTLTTFGNLSSLGGWQINIGDVYDKSTIQYTPQNQSPDTFKYSTNTVDTPCAVNILPCYISCLTCTSQGDTTNHNCSQCGTNYFPLFDNKSNCYLSTDKVTNYTYDSKALMFISACYQSCLTCSGAWTHTQQMCTACNANFYPLEDNSTNCYLKTDSVAGYVFNATENIFRKRFCYISCETCKITGDEINNNCLTCAASYYTLVDNTAMCLSSITQIPSYYFDSQNKIFDKCYSNCKTCSQKGDDINTNCTACAANYYNLIDDNTKCYKYDLQVDGYFFDSGIKFFNKCYKSCKSCKHRGDDNSNNCQSCANNFYPLIDSQSMCFSLGSTNSGYYFDTASSIFNKCFTLCNTCSGPGDVINPNCITCANGLQTCSGCSKFVYQNSCVEECPILTIISTDLKTCISCKKGEVVLNNSCVTECPVGYINNSYSCIDCNFTNMKIFDNQCVDSCPINTLFDEARNTCYFCDKGLLLYKSECVQTCPVGSFINNLICSTCSDSGQYFYIDKCVNECPTGFIADNGNCIDSNAFYSSQITCQDGICVNDGTCSIQNNSINCDCTPMFTGQFCQIENSSGILSDYIIDNSNKLSTPLTDQDRLFLANLLSIAKNTNTTISSEISQKIYQTVRNIFLTLVDELKNNSKQSNLRYVMSMANSAAASLLSR
jgi:hypothetical protein